MSKNTVQIRKTETKKWIVNSFLRLFLKHDYKEITITNITVYAQVARRTFYRYFSSKEDLLSSYIESLTITYLSSLRDEKIVTSSMLVENWFIFWRNHLEFLIQLEHNNLSYILLETMFNFSDEIDEVASLSLQSYGFNHKEITYFNKYNLAGLWNLLFHWVKTGAKEEPIKMAAMYIKITRTISSQSSD